MDKKKVIIMVLVLVIVLVVGSVISSNNKKTTNNTNQTTQTNQEIQTNTSDKSLDNNSKTEDSSDITVGITINKKDITNVAKFFKYKSGNIDMEVMAVKSNDGSIRTAFNTCQVCYDSGRGYYKQEGNYMVCQNCGNRFSIDQIEKIKGGCNPVPILAENKTDNGDTITISKQYLDSQKSYFENWK